MQLLKKNGCISNFLRKKIHFLIVLNYMHLKNLNLCGLITLLTDWEMGVILSLLLPQVLYINLVRTGLVVLENKIYIVSR